MTFFQATLDTEHFEFEAYGETRLSALAALTLGLNRHARQTNMDPHIFKRRYDSEIVVREIEMGAVYRDREPLK